MRQGKLPSEPTAPTRLASHQLRRRPQDADLIYILSITASPNSLVLTSFAPSIIRAKS